VHVMHEVVVCSRRARRPAYGGPDHYVLAVTASSTHYPRSSHAPTVKLYSLHLPISPTSYVIRRVFSKPLPGLAMDMSPHFCGACGAVLLLGAGGAPSCDVCGASLPRGDANAELKLVTRRRLAPSETLRQLTEAATDVGGAQEAEVRFCLR